MRLLVRCFSDLFTLCVGPPSIYRAPLSNSVQHFSSLPGWLVDRTGAVPIDSMKVARYIESSQTSHIAQ